MQEESNQPSSPGDDLAGQAYGAKTAAAPPTTSRVEPASEGDNLDVDDLRVDAVDAANLDERLVAMQAARNPLLEASKYLLRALADMPRGMNGLQMKVLLSLLHMELQAFTTLCERANIRRDHMLAVRYALCTALDEAAQLPSSGEEGVTGMNDHTGASDALNYWSRHALLNRFHQEGDGGNKVFLLIGRLTSTSQEHMAPLEVMYHIVSLGFMGVYRKQTDGYRVVDQVRQRLYGIVSAAREAVPRELSPNWRGEAPGKFKLLRSIPVWVSFSVFGLVLLGMFGWFKYDLLVRAHAVEQGIAEIGKIAPPQKQSLKLAELLRQEIESNKVTLHEEGALTQVVFRGDDMFAPGAAAVNPKMTALLTKVAKALRDVQGHVRVVGHSDNQKISTPQFPDNQTLSLKRAQAVAHVLEQGGVEPFRLIPQGKGDTQPLTDNATAQGRARNRRIEIVLDNPSPTESAGQILDGLKPPASAASDASSASGASRAGLSARPSVAASVATAGQASAGLKR